MNVNRGSRIQMDISEHDVNQIQSPINYLKFSLYSWFHKNISRDESENLLKGKTDGLFLVRESTHFPGDYTLCVCFQNKVEHYLIKSNSDKYSVDDEEFFDNLEELIEHYKKDADGLCTKLIEPLQNENEEIAEQEIDTQIYQQNIVDQDRSALIGQY